MRERLPRHDGRQTPTRYRAANHQIGQRGLPGNTGAERRLRGHHQPTLAGLVFVPVMVRDVVAAACRTVSCLVIIAVVGAVKLAAGSGRAM